MKLLKPNPQYYELHPDWKYVPSGSTDIRKTFRKIRERMAAELRKSQPKVRELKRKS